MSKAAYIYGLCDPRNGTDITSVRYVGKTTTTLDRRLRQHIQYKSVLQDSTHKARWIRKLLRENVVPIMIALEETTAQRVNEREVFWIRYCRQLGCRLTNSTAGGEGLLNPTKSVRRRIGAAKKGHKFWVGKHHSETSKQRISWKRTGKYGGEKHPRASLTWDQVWGIRTQYATGTTTTAAIAETLGISRYVVQDIVAAASWVPRQPTFEQWDLLTRAKEALKGAGKGERGRWSKLTEGQVAEIRKTYATGSASQQSLADEYGVSQSIIGRIVMGKMWAHQSEAAEQAERAKEAASRARAGERNGRARLNREQAREIRDLYRTGRYSQKQLARVYNVGLTTVWHLLQGHTWPEPDANTIA